MFKKINTLNIFDWFLIVGITALNLLYSILQKEADFTGTIASISGVVCVVLVARGNIINYIFGLVNVTLYALISWKAQLYGDAALNALYYLPMQFVGWFQWYKRRESEDSVTVKAKRMTSSGRLLLATISLILVVFTGYFLDILKDPQPYKDAATTVLSVIAMFIMVKRYMEQWILWVIVNAISVAMWIILYFRGAEHSIFMIMMWCAYLANSINGWIVWFRMSKKGVLAKDDF